MGKTPGVEGEITLPSGQRTVVERSRSSHPHFCYELLSSTDRPLPGH